MRRGFLLFLTNGYSQCSIIAISRGYAFFLVTFCMPPPPRLSSSRQVPPHQNWVFLVYIAKVSYLSFDILSGANFFEEFTAIFLLTALQSWNPDTTRPDSQ